MRLTDDSPPLLEVHWPATVPGGAVRKGAVAPEKNFCNPSAVTFSGGSGRRVVPRFAGRATHASPLRSGFTSEAACIRDSVLDDPETPLLPLVRRRGVKFHAPTHRHRRERTCRDPHVCNGNNIQDDPENGFSSSSPFIPPPPSGSLRHSDPLRRSGESRNPEDTFPLDPGFRQGDE